MDPCVYELFEGKSHVWKLKYFFFIKMTNSEGRGSSKAITRSIKYTMVVNYAISDAS